MDTVKLESLAGWGTEAARSIPITGTVSGKKTAQRLKAAMERITRLSRTDDAEPWYADNEYLSRREGSIAAEAFSRAGRLRRGADGAALVSLCSQLVRTGPITEERVEAFLTGARQKELLPENEAALTGAALRMAVILRLAEGANPDDAAVLFTDLRTLAELDMTDALEHSDPVDALLRQDAVYAAMDRESRAAYRAACQRLGKKNGTDPLKQAQTALDAGLHETLDRQPARKGTGYMLAAILLTAIFALAAALPTRHWGTVFAALVPAWMLAVSVLDGLLLRFVRPRRLSRLELADGIPPEGRTICAVFALLSDDNTGTALAKRLEEYRLANRGCGENLLFALAADLPESADEACPEGEARLRSTAEAIHVLNRRYGGGFFLLSRKRIFSAADGLYIPHERKRGAMTALARLITGQSSPMQCIEGDASALYGQYILCLDSDTRLLPDSARALIGAAMHPSNRPVTENGIVVRGHGLIHPRMSLELPGTLATDFSRIYAGQGGTDPYGAPTGELFFDMFSQGGFSGKGIVDAAAYLQCTGSIPENSVLSHDALEGAYLRGAYMGDLELTDSAPSTGAGWFRRLERWTRGDWQNLPWLFSRGLRLPALCRFRLLSSLLRSLEAPAAMFCLVLGFFLPYNIDIAALALICLGFEAIRCAFAGLFKPARDARIRCSSGVLRGVGGALTRFMARVIFLPWEAFTTLFAAVTALWRMAISHRHMLRWSPAGSEKATLPAPLWVGAFLGLCLILFAPGPAGKAMGIVWAFLPVFACVSATAHTPKNDLTDRDRAFLKNCGKHIWDYFSDNCTRSTHWLPPDNVQFDPPRGAALRTSPTNIGMALVSAVAAAELGFIEKEKAAAFMRNILLTLEKLPKWKGHLYNWYDISTCAPLQPPYVSTVDSGNLCACLLCAGNALASWGEGDLSRRMHALADGTELDALYDGKRHLFFIGLDPVTGLPSPGHYDLMASEARLTSYLACAKGQAPIRHWQTLSRAQLSLDGWRGLASWSGSVFEYLMPELFLPLAEGSMLWESAQFCLYAQRKRGGSAPWGASESAFFSLDGAMDYRYKAHGVGALALRRDMDGELIAAPYAGFLALCVHPKAAVVNLRRLKRRHMWGQYGLFEALDMTPGRATGKGQPVACFMSHHLGMSLCAIANTLGKGIMRRYFMDDPACSAYSSLLAERVPLGGAVLRRNRSPLSRPPENRREHPAFQCAGNGWDPDAPAYFPMSNGVYSLLACADGTCTAQTAGLLMYRPDGFSLSVNDIPVTPSRSLAAFLPWRYASGELSFSVPGDNVMSASVAAASGELGELRRLTGPSGGRVSVRFEPVLSKPSDYAAHPAFRRLGLEVSEKSGVVFVRRLARDDVPEVWLCLAATTRLTVAKGMGWQMNEPVAVSAVLPEGGCMSLSLCFGRSREDAYGGARRILSGGIADMPGTMASLLGMNSDGIKASFALCADIARNRVRARPDSPRHALWKHGISGDLPVIYVPTEDDREPAARMIRRHALLTACGVASDLVLADGEDGAYDKPRRSGLEHIIDKYGLTGFVGAKGGIHFCTDEAVAAAGIVMTRPAERDSVSLPGLSRLALRGGTPPALQWHGSAVAFDTPPLPPRAWCNTLTNGRFGYLAADCGTGFMWLENARECPVSPWRNDPLATGGGETLELITAGGRQSLFADGKTQCRVVHGFGWTRWEKSGVSVTAFVPPNMRARVFFVEGGADAFIGWHLPLTMCADPADKSFVITGCEDGCLTAVNPRSMYPEAVFRALSSKKLSGFTCHEPSWLTGHMDGRVGTGLSPCFGALYKGGDSTVIVCGYEDRQTLARLCQPDSAARSMLRMRDCWRSVLGKVRITTPDEDLNRMMNGWAAYQALSARILGRTSMYQSGGAWGFRDQLQDVVNLLFIDPNRTKTHILTCCARQFREGDVLHWWHDTPEGIKGVRTRCSDDLLWLPWAVCEYTEKTGDTSVLEDTAPWLEAPPLRPEEKDRYFAPPVTGAVASVKEHCRRAFAAVLERGTGSHGLLLTGAGDWNDGMDKVGGESLWLTWFFISAALRFDRLLTDAKDPESGVLTAAANTLAAAAEKAWDGSWYLRGWWQDGTPLGAAGGEACAIDSICQSWAAFCPTADRSRVRTALQTAADRLYDPAHGITKLFDPPFGDAGKDPGYIRACGPGFRENGGQYTHGAIWLASALLKENFTDAGSKILLELLPAKHPAGIWGAEPYVLAADVSANADHYGEALWSWYTGSAGWFFRVVLEDLLGIRMEGGRLIAEPHLPPDWEGFEADVCSRHISAKHGTVSII